MKEEYRAWGNMKQRCLNPKIKNYMDYGGRGIKICEEWINSFETFYRDMGDRPDGYSLDRVDVNGNYCKENCRWATEKEQQNNRRDNVKYKGESATEASLRLGGCRDLVSLRIRKGWSKEKAFTAPYPYNCFI